MSDLIPKYSFNPVQKDYSMIKAAALPRKDIEHVIDNKLQTNTQALNKILEEKSIVNAEINISENIINIASHNLAEASQIQEANRVYNQIKVMKDSFNNFER